MIKKPYISVEEVFDKFPTLYGNYIDGQKERYANAFNQFKTIYGVNEAYIASSSGRVEVLGNHTDHNGGKVACSAISLDTLAFFLPATDNTIRIKSQGYPDVFINLDDGKNGEAGTSEALVRGVCYALRERGYNVKGFFAYITSNVIGGAGISSSASYEVLISEIINFLFNDGKIDAKTKAIVSQIAENVYFGKPCGLLDQSAIAFGGLKGLDFSVKGDIIVKDVKCDLSGYTFVLVNTGGSHADLTDEYASIPREMFAVANVFGGNRLIEVGEEKFYKDLPKYASSLSERSILRAVHFFDENNRVDCVCNALNVGDFDCFIECLNKSGESSMQYLQNCYVAGGSQLIPKALAIAKRYNRGGACRVHGGGFAGCILCVVKNELVNEFIAKMGEFYDRENIIPLSIRSVGTITL